MSVRETYVMRDGKLVPKRLAAPLNSSNSPHIISDTIDPTWHPADGKVYDSKSTFRRVTRAHGCEEVGTERQSDRRSYDTVSKADVARAIEMVKQGYRPFTPDYSD